MDEDYFKMETKGFTLSVMLRLQSSSTGSVAKNLKKICKSISN